MEDRLELRTTKEVIDGILLRHKGKNFFQCLKCGGINSDAKELAETLYIVEVEASDSEDESLQELGESCSHLLRQIIVIGLPESCYEDSYSRAKWIKENEQRVLPELSDDFGDEVFIKIRDVVLKIDNVCGCVMYPINRVTLGDGIGDTTKAHSAEQKIRNPEIVIKKAIKNIYEKFFKRVKLAPGITVIEDPKKYETLFYWLLFIALVGLGWLIAWNFGEIDILDPNLLYSDKLLYYAGKFDFFIIYIVGVVVGVVTIEFIHLSKK